MAPKAKGKAKALAKAKARPREQHQRVYLPRGAPARLQQLQAARKAAVLAQPGKYYACYNCGHGVYVPDALADRALVKCDMPRAKLPNGDTEKCDVRTTAQAWKRRQIITATQARARHAAMAQIVYNVESEVQVGAVSPGRFWATIAERVAAVPALAAPAAAVAAAAPP